MSLTRRRFLIGGVQLTAVSPLASSLLAGTSSRRGTEPTLVVLQLSGGNDGLNTVVPHRQDPYFRLRPSLAHRTGTLHALDGDHGLHPRMGGLGKLYADGRVACVHAVGYPQPNRSHFRSMDIWHTADPVNPSGGIGWLGRLADQVAESNDGSMPSMQVGAGNLPLALRGQHFFAPTVRDVRGMRLEGYGDRFDLYRDRLLDNAEGAGDLAFLRRAAKTTYRAATAMQALAEADSPVDYPGHDLGRRLRLVARLISGGFGTRIFHLEHGGFDTHARQAAPHGTLLGQLSSGLSAFQQDLEKCGVADRVLVLVFSEFGRRVAENASRGTDHGTGAPVFLVGTKVAAGMHATAPNLEQLENGDVPFSTDFRRIYTTLERDWMGLKPTTDRPALPLLAT